jgi:hypothetical protein
MINESATQHRRRAGELSNARWISRYRAELILTDRDGS